MKSANTEGNPGIIMFSGRSTMFNQRTIIVSSVPWINVHFIIVMHVNPYQIMQNGDISEANLNSLSPSDEYMRL